MPNPLPAHLPSHKQIEEMEAEGLLEPGTAPEIATYLIISAAQVRVCVLAVLCVAVWVCL